MWNESVLKNNIYNNSYAEGTTTTICGCASAVSPPVGFPPVGTPDVCLATGPATPLAKRILAFSTVIASFKYTCNVDDKLNPFQDCINTMGKICDPTYISANTTRINDCKTAVNTMTLGMSIYWQNVRRQCGQWTYNTVDGFKGSVISNNCYLANQALQQNAYYTTPDGQRIPVTAALTNSVNSGLWGNPFLRE